ncbi:hypothetical protein QUA74_26150 [Microcoleus sp. LAD1_D3]|uniref:hypothetical protein n=1 Tax=Microcoleus sp. LAD1_D3 TaxID=2819365 RepID=UPI002FCF288B
MYALTVRARVGTFQQGLEMERTGLEPASIDSNFQETRFLTARKQMRTAPISDC